MTVREIMTRHLVTVDMDASLLKVRRHFERNPIHHLLVVDGQKLVGIISDRDYLEAISPFIDTLSELKRDMQTLRKRAHRIMTPRPITATADLPVAEAISLMLAHNISCLPVVNAQRELDGIITMRDVLRVSMHAPSFQSAA